MGSPQLLQLSGIGPRDVLAEAGIPVVVDREHVGRRVREHRCFALRLRLNEQLGYNRTLSSSRGRASAAVRYLATRKGMLATPTFEVLAFLKTDAEAERVDGQLLLGPFTIPAYQEGEPISIEREPGLSCLGFALRPTSEGSVTITSADPDAPLRIEPNYLTSDYDRTTTANLIRRTRELFAQSPIADRIDHEMFPGQDAQTDDELVDSALDGGYTGYRRQLRDGAQRRRRRRRPAQGQGSGRSARRRLLGDADHAGGQPEWAGDGHGRTRRRIHSPGSVARRVQSLSRPRATWVIWTSLLPA
jgi:choline dehydrogenase-like flavoprotein